MGKVILLPCANGEFRLEVDQRGWCTVFLKRHVAEEQGESAASLGALLEGANQEVRLGSELFESMRKRLLLLLEAPQSLSNSGKIGGETVSWVLSLSEPHGAMYACVRNEEITLFLQDESARTIATLQLPAFARHAWLDAL